MLRFALFAAVLFAAAPAFAGRPCGSAVVQSFAAPVSNVAFAGAQIQQQTVAVPYALPVGVPVAVLQSPTVLYAFGGYGMAAGYAPAAQAGPAANSAAADASVAASAAVSMVAAKCSKCHGANRADGRLDLQDLTALQPGQRLEAIRRLTTDEAAERMPKGAKLTPAELGALIQELSQQIPTPAE